MPDGTGPSPATPATAAAAAAASSSAAGTALAPLWPVLCPTASAALLADASQPLATLQAFAERRLADDHAFMRGYRALHTGKRYREALVQALVHHQAPLSLSAASSGVVAQTASDEVQPARKLRARRRRAAAAVGDGPGSNFDAGDTDTSGGESDGLRLLHADSKRKLCAMETVDKDASPVQSEGSSVDASFEARASCGPALSPHSPTNRRPHQLPNRPPKNNRLIALPKAWQSSRLGSTSSLASIDDEVHDAVPCPNHDMKRPKSISSDLMDLCMF